MSRLLRFTLVGWVTCAVTACSSGHTNVIKSPDLRLPEAVLGVMLLGERDGAVLDRMTHSSPTRSASVELPPLSASTPTQDDRNGDLADPPSGDGSPKIEPRDIALIDEQVTRSDTASRDTQAASTSETAAAREQVLGKESRALNDAAEVIADDTGNRASVLPEEEHIENEPTATPQPMTDSPIIANAAGNRTSEPTVLPPDQGSDPAQQANRNAEAQAQDEVQGQFAATYGAGPGFTGVTAGASGYTGVGAGSGYTGDGAGNGSTGVGAGSGYTGDGAGNGSTGVGAGSGYTGDGAGNGSTGVGAGSGYTGDGAGNGSTGVGAGDTGSTGIAAERANPSDAATCKNAEPYGGWGAIFLFTPYGPMLLPVAVQ
jgi:hypothetical protein